MSGSIRGDDPTPSPQNPLGIPPGGSIDPVRHDGVGPTEYGAPTTPTDPPAGYGDDDATRTFAAVRDDEHTQVFGAAADPTYGSPNEYAADPNQPAPFGAPRPDEHPEDRFITGSTIGQTPPVPTDDDPGVAKRGFHIPVLGGWLLGIVRILIGWQFLWAFVDKTFGLGFSTAGENAWINGGRPTQGYLSAVVNDPDNPFHGLFETFYGKTWADWLFMVGLLGIGIVLILGLGKTLTWIASLCGVALYLLMYLAAWPAGHGGAGATNPFLDDHLLNAVVLLALAVCNAGAYLGMAKAWRSRRAFKDA